MAQVRIAVPLFARPPAEYDAKWAMDLQRTFAQFAQAVLNPGEGRNTFLVLTDLQDDDVGLEVGTVYKSGNDLKISVLNIAAVRGASFAATVGTVTVVTP